MECPNCGAALTGSTCTYCGTSYQLAPSGMTVVPSGMTVAPGPAAPPEEQIFLDSRNVRVTSARLIIGTQVYSMANIGSVSWFVKPEDYLKPTLWGIVLSLFGLLALGTRAWWLSLLLLPSGVALIVRVVRAKPTYLVRISGVGDDDEVFESKDREFVSAVLTAINEAIVSRG